MPGRRLVAVALPPGPEVLAALRTALEGGDALLPLAPDLPGPELERVLAAMRPAALVTAGGRAQLVGEPVDPSVALVIPTSGSTGAPRGVELTANAVLASTRAGLARLGVRPGERWLCCLPTSHIAGLQVLARSYVLGTEPVVLPRFDVAAVAAADAEWVALVPTMLRRLLDAGANLGRWRGILLGGAAPPPGLVAAAVARGARVVATYGSSETSGGCVYDGRPLDGVSVRLLADGRIAVRGPVLARGYRFGQLLGAEFATSDLGQFTDDGRLEVLGRVDDVITSGGESVLAGEVEAALAGHPAVAEVAVVGRPDPEWGERVVAVVVPAPGPAPTLDGLRSFVGGRLAAWKAPRELVLVDHLPLLPNGKLDRLALRSPSP